MELVKISKKNVALEVVSEAEWLYPWSFFEDVWLSKNIKYKLFIIAI